MSTTTAPPAEAGGALEEHRRSALIGDERVYIKRPKTAKGNRILAELKAGSEVIKELGREAAEFREGYGREHYDELTRVQARINFPPRPIITPQGQPVRNDDGSLALSPSPVDQMTDADWQASGNVLRIPSEPDDQEVIMHLAGRAIELAQDRVYRIVALFLLDDTVIKQARRDDNLDVVIAGKVEWLEEETYFDEVLELVVACYEVCDHHMLSKIRDLGGRVGKLRGLLNRGQPAPGTQGAAKAAETSTLSNETPSTSTTTSPTDSPSSSDGSPTTSSPSHGTSSPNLEREPKSDETPNEPSRPTP